MSPRKRPPEIGQRIAAARLRRGLSQGTVARRSGIAPSYLSRIENRKIQPSFKTVTRIASAMRISLAELADTELPSPRPCPVSRGGHCLLDLIRSELEVARGVKGETYTPREVQMLSRFAAWIKSVPPDRVRAMDILLQELGAVGGDRKRA
ncbi:MAG: helix-turn-helix transcriptional regulator [Acidobacteriota bacterium]|nr:helix-turn-helix transcriptional regulator [Acidobacteriota bacterium]